MQAYLLSSPDSRVCLEGLEGLQVSRSYFNVLLHFDVSDGDRSAEHGE
jgi:hypothetical protein